MDQVPAIIVEPISNQNTSSMSDVLLFDHRVGYAIAGLTRWMTYFDSNVRTLLWLKSQTKLVFSNLQSMQRLLANAIQS